jgi:hypothetical protein
MRNLVDISRIPLPLDHEYSNAAAIFDINFKAICCSPRATLDSKKLQ